MIFDQFFRIEQRFPNNILKSCKGISRFIFGENIIYCVVIR